MTKIAIVGNIAAGKSCVEDLLKQKGFEVYDTDRFTHQILQTSNEIKTAFKNYDILDSYGNICRKKLGNLVFENPKLKTELENIIHPQIKQIIQNINSNNKIVFISVPLLFEAKMESLFDYILFISTDEHIRLQRLMNRNQLTEEEALIRIRAQKDENEKISKSDFVIYNNFSKEDLSIEVEKIIEKIKIKTKNI